MVEMERRPLGNSGFTVTILGLGGGPIGNFRCPISDEEARATIEAAWEVGVRYFDTAPLYGHGRSERRLGTALEHRPRDSFLLSSKVGRLLRPPQSTDFDRHGFVDIPDLEVVYDYSFHGVLRSVEESLERLDLERLDIVFIHDIDRWTHGAEQPRRFAEALDGAYRALADLKAGGVIRAIGLGVNEWEVCRDFALRAPIDCVLLAGRYTLLEQGAAEEFLPLCLDRGMSVVVGGPYNSGILATGPVEGAFYNYAPAPPEVLKRVRRIEVVTRRFGVALPVAALQFPLRHVAVAAVIPGAMSPSETRAAAAAIEAEIPPAMWDTLKSEGLVAS
jgi:D-threo-aldose 1-dehydrogenase